jgi:Family of unknown function (DUF6479)
MDAGKTRKRGFHVSIRSLILVIAVLALLIVPVVWSVRKSRREPTPVARETAAETVATPDSAKAEPAQGQRRSLRDEAIRRAARRDPKKAAERTRQLADEIDGLSQIQGRIQEDLYKIQARTKTPAAPPTLDALRDPRNATREPKDDPDTGSP